MYSLMYIRSFLLSLRICVHTVRVLFGHGGRRVGLFSGFEAGRTLWRVAGAGSGLRVRVA